MARHTAYFIADEPTREKVMEWHRQDIEYGQKLRDLAWSNAPSTFLIAPVLAPAVLAHHFADAAMKLEVPSLEKILGFEPSYDLVPLEKGLYTIPIIRASTLGSDIVLQVTCNAEGNPVYKLPEGCREISEEECHQRIRQARDAAVGPVRRAIYHIGDYFRGA